MKYSLDKKENYSVFSLEEENLNSILAPDLKSEFVFFRNEGVKNLILDLKEVHYVDSSGLSAILTANRLWRGYGEFVITGIVHPTVVKLIEISRLETILTIKPDVDSCVEFLESLPVSSEEEE